MPSSSATRFASFCAVSTHTGMSSERSGTNGQTSVAPKRGWAPSCSLRSMISEAFLIARNAASAIGPSWPTKVTTQRLWVGSLCTSRRLTPSTLLTASASCVDHLGPAALAEVGDALDEGHRGPPSAEVRRAAWTTCRSRTTTSPPMSDAGDEVDAPVVRQFLVRRRVEDEQVAVLARLEAADLVLEAERGRAAQRGGAEGLGRRHPVLLAGQRDGHLQVLAVAAAGVEVGGERHGHAGGEQFLGRRVGGVQRVAGAGQQDGDGARLLEHRDVLGGDVDEVVGGDGAERSGQRRPSGVRQLLGVDLEAVAEGAAGLEHAPRLLDGERALVAEHVDELGLAGQGRQDLVADQRRCTRRRGRRTPRASGAPRGRCARGAPGAAPWRRRAACARPRG